MFFFPLNYLIWAVWDTRDLLRLGTGDGVFFSLYEVYSVGFFPFFLTILMMMCAVFALMTCILLCFFLAFVAEDRLVLEFDDARMLDELEGGTVKKFDVGEERGRKRTVN